MRVRLRIEADGRRVVTAALANSGYEAETPQLMVPVEVAKLLGAWPPPPEGETVFDTAGGPLRVWVLPRACRVSIVAGGAESPEVVADLVVSPLAREVLLSDRLISELQIALEDVGRGLWRFRWEPRDRTRPSEPPKYWR